MVKKRERYSPSIARAHSPPAVHDPEERAGEAVEIALVATLLLICLRRLLSGTDKESGPCCPALAEPQQQK